MNKNIFVSFFIFLFSLSLISSACSLGANPLSMEARAKPGQEVVGTWNLYNLYGDRTTHVKIEKIEGPNWKINYNPDIHKASYEVVGEIQTIEENIAIEKSSVVLEVPKDIPEGMNYVKHPSQEGYIPVKPINIYITIPKDAKIGQNYKFVFEAQGNCFLEAGTAIPGIATQLEFNIKPTTEFYEKPITQDQEDQIKEKLPENQSEKKPVDEERPRITGAVIGAKAIATGILTLTTIILIIVVFVLVSVTKKGKKKK